MFISSVEKFFTDYACDINVSDAYSLKLCDDTIDNVSGADHFYAIGCGDKNKNLNVHYITTTKNDAINYKYKFR